MPIYKEEIRNKRFVSVRYKNWTGEQKQKVKRGFKTKREAQVWEREFLQKQVSKIGSSNK